MTPSQKLILDAFRNLKYPAVYYDDAPEGRFACYIFLKADGFVWLEPGYQSPTEPFSRIRSIDCPLSLKGGCIVFDGGWIGEGDADEGKLIWHYWLDYLKQFDRDWHQEREYVLQECLTNGWHDNDLI